MDPRRCFIARAPSTGDGTRNTSGRTHTRIVTSASHAPIDRFPRRLPMAVIVVTQADFQMLANTAAILRQGRVGDLVHGSVPAKVDHLAQRVAWALTLERGDKR